MNYNFIKRISQILIQRKLTKNATKEQKAVLQEKYSIGKVEFLIKRYELLTKGLQAKESASQNIGTKSFYGNLRSQREKTFVASKLLSGEDIDILQTHLGEINLTQYLETQSKVASGNYNQSEFEIFIAQKCQEIFQEEKDTIQEEIGKFETSSGKGEKKLNCFIIKSQESANARMVGGVCVSGDNPDKGEQNMWDMPNYFQLVLQEPNSLKCVGLVMLHHFQDQSGKKILTASFNHSSTYLYSVDEEIMFDQLALVLEKFAKDNNFNLICTSKNSGIRTNRTGGNFEKSLNQKIAKISGEYTFDEQETFSFSPAYQMQSMDVIWSKN